MNDEVPQPSHNKKERRVSRSTTPLKAGNLSLIYQYLMNGFFSTSDTPITVSQHAPKEFSQNTMLSSNSNVSFHSSNTPTMKKKSDTLASEKQHTGDTRSYSLASNPVTLFFKTILQEVPLEQRVVVYTFFSIYTFFTVTSFHHIIVYFKISNSLFYAFLLALAYEFGSFSLILALIHVERIGKTVVYLILIFLNVIIAIGNSYSSYTQISSESLHAFCEFMGVEPSIGWKRVIAWLQGVTTPIFALSFAKATLNYISPVEKQK